MDIAVRQNDLAGLRELVPLALKSADRFDHALYQAVAHRAQGVLARLEGAHDSAAKALEQALAGFQKLDARWQMARTWFETGLLARDRGDIDQAKTCLARAAAGFKTLQAAPDFATVQTALAALNRKD